MRMKYIELAVKAMVALFSIWGITETVSALKEYKVNRYSYYSDRVIDKQTGKVYSVYLNKLIFDPAKAK